MSKVIIVSRTFPAYHPKAGCPTYFVEKIWKSIDRILSIQEIAELPASVYGRICVDLETNYAPKHHTIRAGKRWKIGDKASLRVWSEKPYRSKQIAILPDITICRVVDFEMNDGEGGVYLDGKYYWYFYAQEQQSEKICELARNDGLSGTDLRDWIGNKESFSGQILIWNNQNLPY